MWPKILMQMIPQVLDLMPHLKRVVPMAEKFLSSKASTDHANEAAIAAMAEGVRGDLGQVASAHAGLFRKLMEMEGQIGDVGIEAKRARMSAESVVARMGALEKAAATSRMLAVGALVLVAGVLVMTVMVYLRLGAVR